MKEWNGKGLPPIGTKCLMFALVPPDGGSPVGEEVTVAAYFNSETWVKHSDGKGSDILPDGSYYFKKLPSLEDKLIDEAYKYIQNKHTVNEDGYCREAQVLGAVTDLIKAGYRLQEIEK